MRRFLTLPSWNTLEYQALPAQTSLLLFSVLPSMWRRIGLSGGPSSKALSNEQPAPRSSCLVNLGPKTERMWTVWGFRFITAFLCQTICLVQEQSAILRCPTICVRKRKQLKTIKKLSKLRCRRSSQKNKWIAWHIMQSQRTVVQHLQVWFRLFLELLSYYVRSKLLAKPMHTAWDRSFGWQTTT